MDTSTVKVLLNNETNKSLSPNTILPPSTSITKELLRYLGDVYPDRVPTVAMSEREIWIEVGKISVVRHLEDVYKMQSETEN
mgnify:CR=1 FL=1